jgi:hypothetical protein
MQAATFLLFVSVSLLKDVGAQEVATSKSNSLVQLCSGSVGTIFAPSINLPNEYRSGLRGRFAGLWHSKGSFSEPIA